MARLKEKSKKQHEWSTRGGYIGPISVPPTPNSELAKSLKAIADSEAEAGVHFRKTETGGISVKSILLSSNPMETDVWVCLVVSGGVWCCLGGVCKVSGGLGGV